MKHSISEEILDNGVKILFIDIPGVTSFDLAVVFNCGYRRSAKDNPFKYELPHVLEHQVFDGSKHYPTNDSLQDVFTSGGGTSNGVTTPYYNLFAFHNRLRNAEAVLRASLDMVFNPLLREDSYNEEIQVIRNELEESMSDILANTYAYNGQQIVPELLTSTDNQLERLPNIIYDDVLKYHRKYYTTKNSTLILATDLKKFPKTTAISLINEVTKSSPKGKRYALPTFTVAPAQPENMVFQKIHKSLSDTTAVISFTIEGSPEQKTLIALGLFGYIASNMKSYSINYKMRKRGLVYGISADLGRSKEAYGIDLGITANNEKFAEVYGYALHELINLAKSGLSDDQFESAKRDFIDTYDDNTSTSDGIISWYIDDYLIEGQYDTISDYKKISKSITKEFMLKAVNTLLKYENLYGTVFSAKAIRASSAMEQLSKAILKDNEEISEQLITDNSIPMGDADKIFKRVMRFLMIGAIVLFILPLGMNYRESSLTDGIIKVIDAPWNFIFIIYYLLLASTLFTMSGKALKSTFAQMSFFFLIVFLIPALDNPGSYFSHFYSHTPWVVAHAWLLLGAISIPFVISSLAYLKEKRLGKSKE